MTVSFVLNVLVVNFHQEMLGDQHNLTISRCIGLKYRISITSECQNESFKGQLKYVKAQKRIFRNISGMTSGAHVRVSYLSLNFKT